MKKTISVSVNCIWCLLAGCVASQAIAQSMTAKALVTWNAEGKVFQISDKSKLFLGELEGVLYVETGEGKMDEGYVSCPVTQEILMKTKQSHAEGYCTIVVGPEDSVFAKWSCSGTVGKCEGKMTFTGGIGKFKKISGGTSILVRSPLEYHVANLASGTSIKTSSGIIIMKDVKYKL